MLERVLGHFGLIDLFAGPGGLAEGFTGYRDVTGDSPFHVELSVEKEGSAYNTLLLRSFLRQFGHEFPQEYYEFLEGKLTLEKLANFHSEKWSRAAKKVLKLELGTDDARARIYPLLNDLDGRQTIVIGGPPCQAYSLAGRSRNRGRPNYVPEQDERHYLYQEFINILEAVAPAAFVMENVKGLISTTISGRLIGDKILSDLQSACSEYQGYKLFPLGTNDSLQARSPKMSDFIIRAENYGIPQARHRLIIVGVRADLCEKSSLAEFPSLNQSRQVPASSVLSTLPHLRSGLSRTKDSYENWRKEVLAQMQLVKEAISKTDKDLAEEAELFIQKHKAGDNVPRTRAKAGRSELPSCCPEKLQDWIVDRRLCHVSNHETRSHMPTDLGRYFFASIYARVYGKSPKAMVFPSELAPDHASWKTGKFADRFRVQLENRPSSTITSHMSKDGHYFIHPDPTQCRSLTIREAARLQTFPDNYRFLGNRTQQYVQIGNAVPPFLACQIAATLHKALYAVETKNAEI